MQKKRAPIICPRCGKAGFLTARWVRSSYYPKYASLKIMQIKTDEEMLAKDPSNWLARRSLDSLKARVKGSRFRGKSKKHLQDHHEEPTDKHPLYKTFSDRYLHRALR